MAPKLAMRWKKGRCSRLLDAFSQPSRRRQVIGSAHAFLIRCTPFQSSLTAVMHSIISFTLSLSSHHVLQMKTMIEETCHFYPRNLSAVSRPKDVIQFQIYTPMHMITRPKRHSNKRRSTSDMPQINSLHNNMERKEKGGEKNKTTGSFSLYCQTPEIYSTTINNRRAFAILYARQEHTQLSSSRESHQKLSHLPYNLFFVLYLQNHL